MVHKKIRYQLPTCTISSSSGQDGGLKCVEGKQSSLDDRSSGCSCVSGVCSRVGVVGVGGDSL